MKTISYWRKDLPNANQSTGLLKNETRTKFIVLSGRYGIELHFPKSLYTYKVLEDK